MNLRFCGGGVSKRGLTSRLTHNRSFRRRVILGNRTVGGRYGTGQTDKLTNRPSNGKTSLISPSLQRQMYNNINKNIATSIKSWSTSCFTFASYHSFCQHNGQSVLSTACDGCTLLTIFMIQHQSRTGGRVNI